LKLEVNGVVVASSLSFPPTGGWDKWSTIATTANLVAGSNKVRLTAIGSAPNIDNLSWSDAAAVTKISSSKALSEANVSNTSLQAFVAPNPASGTVALHVSTASALPFEVMMVDLSGKVYKKLLHRQNGNAPFTFSTAGLPTGLYLLFIKQGTATTTARCVVQNK
jgi:hypothetical protein